MNNNYTNQETLTDTTSTWRPPTVEECRTEIIDGMLKYSSRKWYQKKKYILNRVISFSRTLGILYDIEKE